jgi:internalin A
MSGPGQRTQFQASMPWSLSLALLQNGCSTFEMSSPDQAEARKRIAAELAAPTGRLDLSKLQISELPPELKGLKSLQELDCSQTQVSDLEPLRGLSSLQSLNCWRTQVSNLEPLRGLPRLQTLDCSGTQVSDLEPLRDLSSLQTLNCWSTQVSDLEPLRGLSSLQTLNCLSTQVSDLEPLRGLPRLQTLDCSGTQVSDLEPLRDLSSLQTLDCNYTQVSDLEPLRGLPRLQTLDCSGTQVSDLEPLRDLSSLQTLHCSGTQVSDLEPLRDLSSLQTLNCSATEVSDLEPLRGLSSLQTLDCSYSQVSDLEPLRGLSSLQTLDCSITKVSDLEPLIHRKGLQTLSCRNLRIKDFPRKLLFSESLQILNLNGATIPCIPEEAFSADQDGNCLTSLRAHILDLEVEAIPINSVKILILGNGGVGKTQLCRHLAGEPFDPSVPSTHGITVRSIPAESDGEATYVLWDFGGQDIYHSAHTLFMRTAAVFVVLWTPEQEALVGSDDNDPLHRRHPLPYWLDYVRTLGRPDSPVLVVQSQCDTPARAVPLPPVDKGLLESFGCLRPLNFSAKTGRGAASLQEALADASSYLRDRDGISTIGKGRHRVWQQLEAWRQADEQLPAQERLHRTLSQEQFASLCTHIGGVSSPDALLRFLHNKGVVFHSPELFHDRIILDQSWALDAVYAVFDRGSTYPLITGNDGRLTPSLLANTVWREYEPEAQELFLSLMCTCGILFPYQKADAELALEAVYLAPDLLPPRSSPQVARQLQGRWQGTDPSLSLTYSYDFLHDGLARALLCDLGNHAGDGGVYWRYGAWVHDTRHGCTALLEQEKTSDRAGSLTIRFQGERCGELAEWFQERLAERNRQFGYPDLKPSSSGPLAGQERLRGKRQNLVAAGDDAAPAGPPPQLGPAPVDTFQKSAREVFISYAWGDDTPAGQERKRVVDGLVDALRQRSEGITVHIDRDVMRPGDLISAFMDRLAAADRIIVVISAKYLQSEYCMYELFKIYQNSRKSAEDFHRRIIPIILPDAGFSGGLAARLKPALHWNQQEQDFTSLISGNLQAVGTTAYNKYRLIGEFARNTSDMIEYLIDQLQPRDYDRQIEEGFTELCQQILGD